MRSEREKGGDSAMGVQGCSPGESLVTFFSQRKSPGCRAERLHQEAQELPAPHKLPGLGAQRLQVGAGAANPAKAPGDLQETASYGILIQTYQSDKSTRNRKGRNG